MIIIIINIIIIKALVGPSNSDTSLLSSLGSQVKLILPHHHNLLPWHHHCLHHSLHCTQGALGVWTRQRYPRRRMLARIAGINHRILYPFFHYLFFHILSMFLLFEFNTRRAYLSLFSFYFLSMIYIHCSLRLYSWYYEYLHDLQAYNIAFAELYNS